jgi:E3 ubiquitin-protein ligase RFWD3
MSFLEDDDAIEINLDEEEDDTEVVESWSSEELEVDVVPAPSNVASVDPNRSHTLRNRVSAIRRFRDHLRGGNQPSPRVLPGVVDIVSTPVVAVPVNINPIERVSADQQANVSNEVEVSTDAPVSAAPILGPISNSLLQSIRENFPQEFLHQPLIHPVLQMVQASILQSPPPPETMNMSAASVDCVTIPDPNVKEEEKKSTESNKQECLDESSDNDPGTCLICYEPFTTSSDHRIVCLKCGHLYGKKCIEMWMSTNGSKTRCPECNMLIKKNDVRVIYSRTVKALDTTELDQAVEQLDKVRSQNGLLIEQIDELKTTLGLRESEIYTLKIELNEKDNLIQSMKSNRTQNNLLTLKNQSIERKREAFKLRERLRIQSGGARLICIFEILDYVVISLRIHDSLYDGFGLRKFSIQSLRRHETVPLHKKMIRDMAMHPREPLILTASTDRTIKLTNMISLSVVRTFTLEVEPWSVCWDSNATTRFFAGLNNGKLIVCCTQTGSVLKEFGTPLKSPIVSLQFLSTEQDECPGLLVVGMNASLFAQFSSTDHQDAMSTSLNALSFNSLNVEDRFLSAHVLDSNHSGHFLLSCRPTSKINNVHHWVIGTLFLFKLNLFILDCDLLFAQTQLIDYTFEGVSSPLLIKTQLNKSFDGGSSSSMLTKSKIYPHPNDVNSALLCCSDEQEKGILIWESSHQEPLQKLKCGSIVLDVALMKRSSEIILIALTDSELLFFSWSL